MHLTQVFVILRVFLPVYRIEAGNKNFELTQRTHLPTHQLRFRQCPLELNSWLFLLFFRLLFLPLLHFFTSAPFLHVSRRAEKTDGILLSGLLVQFAEPTLK